MYVYPYIFRERTVAFFLCKKKKEVVKNRKPSRHKKSLFS